MGKAENKHYIWFDWAVKHILRNKANFEILEGFIKVMTGKEMTILEILESEGNQPYASAKFNRVDIKARNEDGETVIIEVQNIREMDFLERILFGVASAVTEQVQLGEPYANIRKVYSISIVYFNFGIGDDYVYHGQTELRGIHTDNKLLINANEREAVEGKSADEVFPEYFIIRVKEFIPTDISPNYMEQWMEYLKTGNIRPEYDAPGLPKARRTLIFDSMSPGEKKNYRDYIDFVRVQEDAIKDSRAEGFTEGMEKGMEKGIIQTAKNMIQMGLDSKLISQATGLTEEEIENLRKA